MSALTIMPSPVFEGFDSNGDPLNGGKLYTYAAGTSTPLATYTTSAGTVANANPVILDSAGRAVVYLSATAYKFVLATSADVTVWTQDNISAVPFTSSDTDIDVTAGEALTANQCAYLADGTGGTTAGRWYKTDSDAVATSVTPQSIGFVVADIASAGTGTIRMAGRLTGLSGLTPGAIYYISATAGAITSSAPANARVVATADSTTSIVIATASQPAFATATVAGIVSTATQSFGGAKTFVDGLTSTGAATFSSTVSFASAPVGVPTFARQTADVTKNNNTTLADLTGLAFSVGANEVWAFCFYMHGVSAAAAGFRFTLTGPAASTALRFGVSSAVGGGSITDTNTFGTAIFGGTTNTVDQYITLGGLLRNGANAGTVQAQFAQQAADASNSVVYAESHVLAFRIS